jgi:hypothetical protein
MHYGMSSMNNGHDLLGLSGRSPLLRTLDWYNRADGRYFCSSAEHSLCWLIAVSMLLSFVL